MFSAQGYSIEKRMVISTYREIIEGQRTKLKELEETSFLLPLFLLKT